MNHISHCHVQETSQTNIETNGAIEMIAISTINYEYLRIQRVLCLTGRFTVIIMA